VGSRYWPGAGTPISDVPDSLYAARRVATGGSAVDPTIVSTLLSRRRKEDPLAQLTPREREVLALMAAGTANQGIADRLVIMLGQRATRGQRRDHGAEDSRVQATGDGAQLLQ
jgi:hypothetical protein